MSQLEMRCIGNGDLWSSDSRRVVGSCLFGESVVGRVRQRGIKQKQSGSETIKRGEEKLENFPRVFLF